MSSQYQTPDLLPSNPKALAVAISAALAGTSTAQAQNVLEEIVVTATKREESLQDIPMSVTAFTDSDIVREGFKSLDDYVGRIPGLTSSRREPGGSSVIMRGCALSAVAFGASSTTSVYLDEQPITAAGFNPDPRLIDIDRVEALSGPQGSLFGDSSQCGTLRILTNKPNTNEFNGWVDATGSQIDDGDLGYDFSGMVNIPLVEDKLALRLVGFHAEEAGYIDNILGNSIGGVPALGGVSTFDNAAFVEDDVNSSTVSGGRVGLRWTPNEIWTIDAQAIYQKSDVDGFGDASLPDNEFAGRTIGELEQIRFGEETFTDEWYQLSLTVEAKLDFADVLVTGSFMNRKTNYLADATVYSPLFPAYTYLGGLYDFGDRRDFATDIAEDDNWTFETRISTPSDSDSRWAGLLGFFYNKDTNNDIFTSNGVGLSDNCVATQAYSAGCEGHSIYNSYAHYFYFGVFETPSDNWWTGVYDETVEQIAVFGEISFDFTDNLTITAGGRWFEIKDDRFNSSGPNVPFGSKNICGTDAEQAAWQVTALTAPTTLTTTTGPGTATFTTPTTTAWTGGTTPSRFVNRCFNNSRVSGKESGWVPKVNATYTFDEDKLVYFTYSEGFRRGGVNAAKAGPFSPSGALHTFIPDNLINFEAGFKSTMLDGRFRLNLTAYHMIWEDLQIEVNDPTGTFFLLGIINLSEAELNGVEADFAWLPAEGWNISGNLGYNNAELSEDTNSFGLPLTKGSRLPLMPELKTNLSIEYTFQREIFGAEPYILGSWQYQGDSLNSLSGLGGTAALNTTRTHPSYHNLDLRAGLTGADWSASFYIDNVANEHSVQLFNERWIKTRATMNQPRSFGINFRKNFGK